MRSLILAVVLAAAFVVATPAAASHKIRCGNGLYKEAMKNKRVLLKGKTVRCTNFTYKGKSAVINWTRTPCRKWGQSIVLLSHEHFLWWVITAKFQFSRLTVWNTCTGRLDFVVPAPR